MKKFAVVLVLVGVLSFSAVGLAVAQTYPVTLCINNTNTHLIATLIGSVGGKSIYNLNGWLYLGQETVLSGTATIADDTILWGFTLQNAMNSKTTLVYEFITDLDFYGSGEFEVTSHSGGGGPLTIVPGPCAPPE
jgi:hypothetical protein